MSIKSGVGTLETELRRVRSRDRWLVGILLAIVGVSVGFAQQAGGTGQQSTRTFAATDPRGTSVYGTTRQTVSAFDFKNVPPGDVVLSLLIYGRRPAGSTWTWGTLDVMANGKKMAQYASHCFYEFESPSIWGTLTITETLPGFAGGMLSIELTWTGDHRDSGVTFGFQNDPRFARRCRIVAGL